MKTTIKRVFRNISICTIMAACVYGHNIKASNEFDDIKIVAFHGKKIIIDIFTSAKKVTLTDLRARCIEIIAIINIIKKTVETRYKRTKTSKDKVFLELLKEIEKVCKDVSKFINQKGSLGALILLGKLEKKYSKASYEAKIIAICTKAEQYLTQKETDTLYDIVDMLKVLKTVLPQDKKLAKAICKKTIKAIWARK